MNRATLLVLSAIGSLWTLSAQADIVTFTGDTTGGMTGGMTFDRPFTDLSGPSGNSTRYNSYTFTVSQSGTYTFASVGRFDTFAYLYTPTFIAASPSTGAQMGNYGVGPQNFTNAAGFAANLMAGTTYSYVTTGFDAAAFGIFSATIGGAGTITGIAGGSPATSPNIATHLGTTASGPTYNRPALDENTGRITGLSNTTVAYDRYTFRVAQDGDYTFVTTGAAASDTFNVLYDGAFDPANSLANAVVANDQIYTGSTPFNFSGFTAALVRGVDYSYITSSFDGTTRTGIFSTTIGGPGAILVGTAAVPEPGTMSLLFLGLGAVVFATRRRRAGMTA